MQINYNEHLILMSTNMNILQHAHPCSFTYDLWSAFSTEEVWKLKIFAI